MLHGSATILLHMGPGNEARKRLSTDLHTALLMLVEVHVDVLVAIATGHMIFLR